MSKELERAGAPEMLSFDYAGKRYLFPFDAAAEIACQISDAADADVAPIHCVDLVAEILRVLASCSWRVCPPPAHEVRREDT